MPHDRKNPSERHQVEDRQHKEVTGEAETYVFTRSADFSFWAKSAAFYEKYKVLWFLFWGFLLALGFDFKTPSQFYKELKQQVTTLEKKSGDAEVAREKLDRKLNILITFRCLEQDERDMSIAGVDCSAYINANTKRRK